MGTDAAATRSAGRACGCGQRLAELCDPAIPRRVWIEPRRRAGGAALLAGGDSLEPHHDAYRLGGPSLWLRRPVSLRPSFHSPLRHFAERVSSRREVPTTGPRPLWDAPPRLLGLGIHRVRTRSFLLYPPW